MKKLLKVIISLFIVGVLLGGCQENSKVVESVDGRTTITMWNRISGLDDFLPDLISSFEDENPNIKVELTNLPVEGQEAQFQAAVQANELPDIFTLGGGFTVPDMVEAEQIRDLNELFPEEIQNHFVTGSFEQGQTMIGDKIYAFPIFSSAHNTFMLYYNKDLLENLGIEQKVPRTWSELIEISKEVYEKSEGKSYGLLIGMKAGWLISDATLQMARSITPETGMNWKTGEYDYATQGLIETVKFYKTMLDENAMSIQSLELGAQDVYTQFANGHSAFMIAGNYVGEQLYDRGLENFGVASLPTKNSDGEPFGERKVQENISVSRYTEHWPEVKKFINYLVDNMYSYIAQRAISEPAKKIEFVKDAEPRIVQYNDIVKIMQDTMVLPPNPAEVNLETIKVSREYGQMAPKEGLDTLITGYLSGQIKDLESALQEFTNSHNAALNKAIEQSAGKVTKEDYIFPNWIPGKDFTEENY